MRIDFNEECLDGARKAIHQKIYLIFIAITGLNWHTNYFKILLNISINVLQNSHSKISTSRIVMEQTQVKVHSL